MTNWYPNENIIRFCARLIQKRLTYDQVEIKRKVKRVLDLGCGNGRHAIYFAREGMEACGIDISSTAIEWAQDWAKREGFAIDCRGQCRRYDPARSIANSSPALNDA